jgi:hypothetical protein
MDGDRKADLLARDAARMLWLYLGNGRGGSLSRVESRDRLELYADNSTGLAE